MILSVSCVNKKKKKVQEEEKKPRHIVLRSQTAESHSAVYIAIRLCYCLFLKERKKTFNGKWQASSNSPSQWATENHAYSMDLIFIGKSQGWQHGSLNSFLCFCFFSSVVSHLQVWHHMHKNIVNFTYLYLHIHMSVFSMW